MKIAVMGAGGIGSYLGGMLARNGVDVTLICRGRHLAAIRERGLALSSPKHAFSVPIAAREDCAGRADVILQTTKLYQLEASTRQMLPMVGEGTIVLPLQNGVTAMEEVGAIVGAEKVRGATVFLNARLTAPGVVESRSEMDTVVFDERAKAFIELCRAAGIDARPSADIRAEQWRKFLPVAGLSALSCLSRQPIGPVRDEPRLRALYRQAMTEVATLARAKGVALEADAVERMLALAERYKYDARVSMLEDLEAGKPLELEWLSGYVSREAARLGVPAPFHDMAYACLKPLSR
ncbi:MAG TPA: 2-dehydropantoate 2-reductase [Burkholderiales bacterium]|nr:2-dehydropantoate 2-reductase [Burkholderiales bacterium]